MNEHLEGFIAGGVLLWLGYLVLLVGTIVLCVKSKSIGSYIMLIGIVLMMVVGVLSLLWPALAAEAGPERILEIQGYNSILGGLSNLVFGVGVLVFAIQFSRRNN